MSERHCANHGTKLQFSVSSRDFHEYVSFIQYECSSPGVCVFFSELFALRALRLRRACPASLLPPTAFSSTMAAERGSVQYQSTGETTEWEVSSVRVAGPAFLCCASWTAVFQGGENSSMFWLTCCTLHGFPSCPSV